MGSSLGGKASPMVSRGADGKENPFGFRAMGNVGWSPTGDISLSLEMQEGGGLGKVEEGICRR